MRETAIEGILERYQDDLEAMTDEQLEEQCR
jgi:C4-type Zn-finger protein